MTPAHLYVHAPFCARRCSYCDFAVTVDRAPDPGPWQDAIAAELSARADRENWERLHLDTLYVGGGTPSLLGPGVMSEMARRFHNVADWDATALEWTCEANPEHFSRVLAEDWRAAGVNRLSLGAQSFDPGVLAWMGRLHGPDGPARALDAARSAGFDNVSIDLIFGLPPRLGRDWRADLERVIALDPPHVSLYGLTAEPGAPLGRWVAEGRETLADEDLYATEYLQAAELLTAAGYLHYEVSNFARPGCESRHNAAYWSGAPYLGLGPGAHSFLPPRRFWNTRDFATYAKRVLAEGHALDGEESVDGAAAELERSWLGLRTAGGLELRNEGERDVARHWQDRGWAVTEAGRVRLTRHGWLLLDRLAVELGNGLNAAEAVLTFRG